MWNMVTIVADTILYLKFAKKVELKWSHQEKEKMMTVLINGMGRILITMFTKKKKKEEVYVDNDCSDKQWKKCKWLKYDIVKSLFGNSCIRCKG